MSLATVAFIGTGIMGKPMARNLLQAGYPVRAWNRSPAKAQELAAHGADILSTPALAAKGAQVLVCMLSDGPTCDEVLFGEGGAARVLAPGALVIVMSSIAVDSAVEQARQCAALGLRYLDAPVSGGERGAREASLAIMVGGEVAAFEQGREVLAAMGRPVHVGPAGTGELSKLVNQLIVASTIATVAEGLLLAERGGADPSKVHEALMGGFVDSPIWRQHGQRMLDNDFTPGGPAKWQLKDTRTALAQAQKLGLSLPVGSLVDGLFQAMIEAGDGELDHAGLIRQLRRHNQLPE
ncbi:MULTISPECIES: NAD(P)-dependent oxidoreductase [Pseudomonas]|jgi:3-hydroxyisobutyrate dehydrogenase-like beta-hydroxyacid dehydrogenase|uniref:2-hydroxy-3-oxopropionate reductase n=1 Tax=Pseudomonas versuta TaxID=1788301 RepID=A0A0M4QSN8_9PSED|nr:NAD(P)-dependent oxidoreductase [Pseudomonas versuta]ALE89290.1 2-hydroxy-3-oxopropionate reductase [Pseudomonas versuta]NBF14101.1 NAD-binding protein [Pseudomonas sp. Fl4BN2]OKA19731.1 2-hydroxy-3-oxopropionate reductase [Pseudomonas versuta]OKA23985.1 2-hydroxy-3-oxopropionate reductase [Pseudomonas versuta]